VKKRLALSLALISALAIGCIAGFTYLSQKNQQKAAHELEQTIDTQAQKEYISEQIEAPSNQPKPTTSLNQAIKLPIILYHYVEYVKDRKDKLRQQLNIQPNILEAQLHNLQQHHYKTIWIKEIPSFISEGKSPSQTVALTFDDGYSDFYTDVFPLLKKYNTKATLYMIAGWSQTPGYLTVSQLQEIQQSGLVEIAAHTMTHPKLTHLTPDQQKQEIQQSKSVLENELHIKVETFAYPYGFFNDEIINETKAAGFTAAVSVIPGAYHSTQDLYTLHRIRAGAFYGKDMAATLESLNK
jgi:peptidoglycan/xylan/chitin deacetylase (PgdA/CDA1 family)